MPTDRAPLRATLRNRRRIFVEAQGSAQLRVYAVVMARIVMAALEDVTSVAAYVSNGREVDALPTLELACARGLATALPHITEAGAPMRFLQWRPGDALIAGPYGTVHPHPDAPEIAPEAIVAPLLGFDRQGNRIGQGGGYFDRAFAALPNARRIGLAWSVQEIDAVPVESWDQPLHAVVTEHEWITC